MRPLATAKYRHMPIQVWGWSMSRDLIDTGYPWNAILLRINENNGRVIWDLQIKNIATLSSIMYETGIDVRMDSAQKIYLLTRVNNKFHLSVFQYTGIAGPIAANFYHSYGDDSMNKLNILIAVFHPYFDYLYIGGNYQGDLAMIKINLADGLLLTGAAVPQSSTYTGEAISKIAIFIDTNSDQYQVACASFLGNGDNVGFMYFKQLTDGTNLLLYTWYLTMTYSTFCTAVNYDGITISYLLFDNLRSRNYFGTRSVSSSTNFDIREIYYAAGSELLTTQNAYIPPSGLFFIDIGSLTQVNSQTYSRKIAYLGRFPVGQSCIISSASNTDTFSSIYQDSFVTGNFQQQNLIILTSSSLNFELREDLTKSSSALTSLNLIELPSECLDYVYDTGNVNSPVVGAQVYTVGDPPLIIQISQFTYSENCADTPTWVYQGLKSDYSPLPSFIQFAYDSTGSSFTVQTLDQQTAATYQLVVIGTASGLFTGYSFFQLQVVFTPADSILRTYDN
ncbi:UNKNOWN [Stylonychia lemnae]|uniref:Uncharacterized protein n=1 Tax=Stylonychia lemnae TaxID=5949 RepID=A0A078AYK5_STYLE|nr:UNKNOWN [Stylonychia lemnae]|eukprot:CDW85868.1 UNKNOWN [Stylonychia lemnae]